MSDWYEMTIGSVATLRKGISYKSEDYCNEGSGYPFITIKCFVKGGGYEPSGLKYFDGYCRAILWTVLRGKRWIYDG